MPEASKAQAIMGSELAEAEVGRREGRDKDGDESGRRETRATRSPVAAAPTGAMAKGTAAGRREKQTGSVFFHWPSRNTEANGVPELGQGDSRTNQKHRGCGIALKTGPES